MGPQSYWKYIAKKGLKCMKYMGKTQTPGKLYPRIIVSHIFLTLWMFTKVHI